MRNLRARLLFAILFVLLIAPPLAAQTDSLILSVWSMGSTSWSIPGTANGYGCESKGGDQSGTFGFSRNFQLTVPRSDTIRIQSSGTSDDWGGFELIIDSSNGLRCQVHFYWSQSFDDHVGYENGSIYNSVNFDS